MQEDGRLRYFGLLQVSLCAFEHDIGNAEAESLVGLFEIFAGQRVVVIQRFTHARELGTLARENICVFHTVVCRGENKGKTTNEQQNVKGGL